MLLVFYQRPKNPSVFLASVHPAYVSMFKDSKCKQRSKNVAFQSLLSKADAMENGPKQSIKYGNGYNKGRYRI